MKKLVLVLALLVAIPVMLVGCSKSDSASIKDSINGFVAALNDGDYEKCTDYLVGITDANKAAIAAELGGLEAYVQSIEVTKIEEINVDGSSATAKVTMKVTLAAALGGGSMEQTIDLPLSKVDGTWKFTGDDIIPSTGG
jgi:hypothetical protein